MATAPPAFFSRITVPVSSPFRGEPGAGGEGIFQQANRVIAGITRDSNGNPLAGCTVYLFNAATMTVAATATSDGSGNYSFPVDPTQTYFTLSQNPSGPVQGVTAPTLVGV